MVSWAVPPSAEYLSQCQILQGYAVELGDNSMGYTHCVLVTSGWVKPTLCMIFYILCLPPQIRYGDRRGTG